MEITKVDANTISMPALYFSEENSVNVVIDPEAKTLTIQPTDGMWGYYTLAGTENAQTPIVGTYTEDGVIEFNDWTAWYYYEGDGWYYYLENCKAKLTR